jgi:hypothetical protein
MNTNTIKSWPEGSNRLPVLADQAKRAHAGVRDAAKTAVERAIEAR